MQQILIIEDDKPLAQLIQRLLDDAGFKTQIGNSVKDVQLLADNHYQPDLILCDIMLPDGDGLSLSHMLQSQFQCPFIYLTALDSDDTQVKGLNLGACDYLVKPIKPAVLLARVKANLRKTHAREPIQQQLGQLKLDLNREIAFFGDVNMQVGQDEFHILRFLLAHDPKPVSRELLFKEIVGREYDGMDRAIDLKISRLRKKMAHCSNIDIKSVRGKGYTLTLDVSAS